MTSTHFCILIQRRRKTLYADSAARIDSTCRDHRFEAHRNVKFVCTFSNEIIISMIGVKVWLSFASVVPFYFYCTSERSEPWRQHELEWKWEKVTWHFKVISLVFMGRHRTTTCTLSIGTLLKSKEKNIIWARIEELPYTWSSIYHTPDGSLTKPSLFHQSLNHQSLFSGLIRCWDEFLCRNIV